VRADTAIWAPLVTETVSHLFLLSALNCSLRINGYPLLSAHSSLWVCFTLDSAFNPAMEIYLGAVNFAAAAVPVHINKKGI